MEAKANWIHFDLTAKNSPDVNYENWKFNYIIVATNLGKKGYSWIQDLKQGKGVQSQIYERRSEPKEERWET